MKRKSVLMIKNFKSNIYSFLFYLILDLTFFLYTNKYRQKDAEKIKVSKEDIEFIVSFFLLILFNYIKLTNPFYYLDERNGSNET